jgi:hypothetical protein
MSTPKKTVTKTDVTRAMAAIEANIKELVRLLGDPDDDVSEEAGRALLRIGELAVDLLTGAILRPRSPMHRIRAILAVRFIHPKDSLAVQEALSRVEATENDQRIGTLAGAVLLEVILDYAENQALKGRRQMNGSDPLSRVPTGSSIDPQNELIAKRLSELRAQE